MLAFREVLDIDPAVAIWDITLQNHLYLGEGANTFRRYLVR